MAHITKRVIKSGDRYDVKFMVNGRHRRQTFKKKADAVSFRNKVEANELAGMVTDPKGGERLFGPYADSWIETRLVKGKPLSPATKQGYRALMRRHLTPAFGGTKLRQITKERVRSWHNKLAAQQPDQAAKAYRLLRAILMTADQDDLIPTNPCIIKGAGAEPDRNRTGPETETVLALADAIEPRLRCLILLAGFGGLRVGELLGLQRQDVDLLHGNVTVARAQLEITGGLGTVLTDPKSDAGKRTVPMQALMDELSEHLDEYVAPEPEAHVFTRPSGRPLRRADLSIAWQDACAKVGVSGVHMHDLRHHALTLVAHSGATTKEIMVFGGHSSPRAALIYQAATAKRMEQIASHIGDAIATAKRAPKSAPARIRPQEPRHARGIKSAGSKAAR